MQNQILRTLSPPVSVARLEQRRAEQLLETRADWARSVCETFQFFDAHGRAQVGSCSRALSKRADRGGMT